MLTHTEDIHIPLYLNIVIFIYTKYTMLTYITKINDQHESQDN
jgi:hypothetical protein